MTPVLNHMAAWLAVHTARPEPSACEATGMPVRPSLGVCPRCDAPIRCECEARGLAHIPRHPARPDAVTVIETGELL